ncbi:MAG TPA: DUF1684 domain-containing protein [Holophagaceae bacterium]|nr:DUF1684 domain-containing protein [Holophagaceae bacterium]
MASAIPLVAQASFQADEAAWRAQRLAALTKPDGWLSVAGLDWLEPGANTIGSAPDAALRLPTKAPARVGTLTWAGGKVHFQAAPGVTPTLGGKPFLEGDLAPDDAASVLSLGDLRFGVIARGSRMGLRLRDLHSETFDRFQGIPAYAPDPAYRVVARFEPYAPMKATRVATVIGVPMDAQIPGRVTFILKGKTMSLEPILDDDGTTLFFIFRDGTTGHGSYPAGRFLYAEPAKDGTVILDFNRAENPPCAFTTYATCPMAPPQNTLPLAIEAGEKDPHLH